MHAWWLQSVWMLFQHLGPAAERARSPKQVFDFRTFRSPHSACFYNYYHFHYCQHYFVYFYCYCCYYNCITIINDDDDDDDEDDVGDGDDDGIVLLLLLMMMLTTTKIGTCLTKMFPLFICMPITRACQLSI